MEGGPKRVWVNGGGVLWKEKGASVQDFACLYANSKFVEGFQILAYHGSLAKNL